MQQRLNNGEDVCRSNWSHFVPLLKVKVIKSKMDSFWYSKQLGKSFYVRADYSKNSYLVIPLGETDLNESRAVIDKDDVEILETFQGDVIERVTRSIIRSDGYPVKECGIHVPVL